MPSLSCDAASPFDLFGIKKSFLIDEAALENRYYELSKRMHPDRVRASSPLMLSKSQELAAILNQAYAALRKPDSRLEALLEEAGKHMQKPATSSNSAQQIPSELAEEYFELQEMMLEDPAEAQQATAKLRQKIELKKSALTEQVHGLAGKIDWLTPSDSELEAILKLRREYSYVRSLLENIERLIHV